MRTIPGCKCPSTTASDALERIEETQLAEHLQLLAADLLDPEFVRTHPALVDHRDAMPCPRKHGSSKRSRKTATDDRDISDNRRLPRSLPRRGRGSIRRHGSGSTASCGFHVQFSRRMSDRGAG
jgi:hypothetical protein